MGRPEHINIVEVGPRDSLQNEAQLLLPSERIELIEHLMGFTEWLCERLGHPPARGLPGHCWRGTSSRALFQAKTSTAP